MDREGLLTRITQHYLDGRDFNGYPLRNVNLKRRPLDALLTPLVREGLISLNFATYHPNPYIKAFDAEDAGTQLERLGELDDITHLTAYPERPHLETVVDLREYEGRPFSQRLALGAAELHPVYFGLEILEVYRNDPRYYYTTDDISGTISATDELDPSDQVLVQGFGYGHNEKQERAVCAFLVDLHKLSPEHQQIWAARELAEGYKMHPAFYQRSIMGEFSESESMFTAFTAELAQLQEMCAAAGLPPIVRESYDEGRKPAHFTFLIRPTLKELQDFHATLDKLMSENLNKAFFEQAGVVAETETVRKDGKVVVTQKGTVTLLEEWLQRIRFDDPEPAHNMVDVFREVRRLRQRPAHAADDNRFDLAYYNEQRELMVRAYSAIRTLRLILANHPDVKDYDGVPDWLYEGKIYTF